MCRLTRNNILIMAFMFYGVSLAAQNQQDLQDSVRIYFKQGKIELVPTLRENRSALNRITDTMRITGADSAYHLRKILVEGGASPEGSVKFNRWLSEKRAKALFDYLSHYGELPDSLKTTRYLGRDWNGLIRLVENDLQLPYKEETLSMLRQIASEQKSGAQAEERHLQKIQKLRGGTPYLYMYRKYFPLLRSSKLHLWYEKVHRSEIPKPENLNSEIQKSDTTAAAFIPPADTICAPDTQSIASQRIRKPFYMDIRTNMLYDALLIPNIGVEMYLGKKMVGGCQLDVRMVEDRPQTLVPASLRRLHRHQKMVGKGIRGETTHRTPHRHLRSDLHIRLRNRRPRLHGRKARRHALGQDELHRGSRIRLFAAHCPKAEHRLHHRSRLLGRHLS